MTQIADLMELLASQEETILSMAKENKRLIEILALLTAGSDEERSKDGEYHQTTGDGQRENRSH